MCEKPLCFTSAEAEELQQLCKAQQKIIGVTYGYAGHQLIQQARTMIADGLLGEIRIVNMQFAHGFHHEAVELQNASTAGASIRVLSARAMCWAIWPPIRCLSLKLCCRSCK